MQVGNGAVVVSGSSLFLVLYIFYLAMCIAEIPAHFILFVGRFHATAIT